jgi:uncharacterized membrane protein (UPF0127 family)
MKLKNTKKEKIVFGFKKHKFSVKNYRVCSSYFSKLRGLMFRSRNYKTPLLFVFNKPGKYPIHSFFCRKFLGVWMLNSRIIDVKIVSPYKFSVIPQKKFNRLLEIPLTKI